MTDHELENLIARRFAALPRKTFVMGDKQSVWLKIQNHLRQTRASQAQIPISGWGYFGLRRLNKLGMTAVIVVIATSLAGGVAKAAKGSLPGETLYPVKKAVEQVQVVIASAQGGEKKVETLKTHAKTRLLEVSTLVTEKNATKETVKESLDQLRMATGKVVAATEDRPELLPHAVELTAEEEKTLTEVQTKTQGEIKQAVENAIAETKESFNKLIGQEKKDPSAGQAIEGAQTTAPSPSESADKIQPNARALNKTQKPKDGAVESGIQLERVTSGSSSSALPEPSRGPTVLPEPSIGF